MNILIDADGCPGVSDVLKNKTSSRILPLIRLNLRLLAEMVGILPRAKQQPAGLIACGLRAATLFSSAPSLPQKRHQPEPVPFGEKWERFYACWRERAREIPGAKIHPHNMLLLTLTKSKQQRMDEHENAVRVL